MTINILSGGDVFGTCCMGVLLLLFVVALGYAWRYGTLLAEHDAAGKQERKTTGGDSHV